VSSTEASAAFFFTDSIPLSRLASDSYISLVPITCPLVAFRLKNHLPLAEVLRSKRTSSWLFFFTYLMPFQQAALVV
jgi:hypothetical protein